MKKTYKTIRVSQDTYEELLAYRANLEQINRCRVSFDESINLLFGEVAGMEYEIASQKAEIAEARRGR